MTKLAKPFFIFTVIFLCRSSGSEIISAKRTSRSPLNILYFKHQSAEYLRDCQEAINQCSSDSPQSSVYLIKPDQYPEPFQVYCENNGTSGLWTVIQRRFDGHINFTRSWSHYKFGFGFLGSEFWIGNERLAHLTNQKRYELRVDVETTNGRKFYLTYHNFRMADEWGNYSLSRIDVDDEHKITDLPITWCLTNQLAHNGSICQKSCGNPNECMPPDQLQPEKCVCQGDSMIHKGSCLLKEQCGCYDQNTDLVLEEGEAYVNSSCSSQIECKSSKLIRRTYSCSSDATCEESNGVGSCTCNRWFEGDGVTCTLIPCYVEEIARVLAESESYINSVCSSRISCNNNRLISESYRCGSNANCEERDGVARCTCNEWFDGDGITCTRNGPKDCYDLYIAGRSTDMTYTIYPEGSSSFEVYCDMTNGGWTVFQKRTSGSYSFYRNWNDYKNGFGNLRGDHWLGNDKIYKLTNQPGKTYQLYIKKTNRGGSSYYTRYSSFSISNEGQRYQLFLGGYSGNSGNNAMGASSGYQFSTYDRDYDGSSTYDCAEKHRGGWWYPDDSNIGSTEHCSTFSNTVDTGRYEYTDCGCYRCCFYSTYYVGQRVCTISSRCSASPCSGGQCGYCEGRQTYKCLNCDGCSGDRGSRCCRNKNRLYETTFYSCGYSNLNGDYQYQDYRGIFWKNLHGSDCGITTTIMKIRPTL